MGRMTGWRVAGVAAVVAGVIALGVYSGGQRNVVGEGVWEIGAGQARAYEMVVQRETRVSAEVVPSGARGDTGGALEVFWVDENEYRRWKVIATEEGEVKKLGVGEVCVGSKGVVLGGVAVTAGKYYLVAKNTGREKVRVRWEVREER
jgi:hypothetical protein